MSKVPLVFAIFLAIVSVYGKSIVTDPTTLPPETTTSSTTSAGTTSTSTTSTTTATSTTTTTTTSSTTKSTTTTISTTITTTTSTTTTTTLPPTTTTTLPTTTSGSKPTTTETTSTNTSIKLNDTSPFGRGLQIPPQTITPAPVYLNSSSFGFSLAQHNNPDKDEQSRQQQAFPKVNFDGTCLPIPICADQKYRNIDGGCNNLANPTWGQANNPFRRFFRPRVALGKCGLEQTSLMLPNARLASWALISRTEADLSIDFSMMLMVFGQLVDHDMTMTPVREAAPGKFLDCCNPFNARSPDCCPINISPADPFYSAPQRTLCIPMIRSRLTNMAGPSCQQFDVENANTAFIDASFLYGSDADRAQSLRLLRGGLLKTTDDRLKRPFPFLSTVGGVRMVFGDTRGDVHPAFTLLTTVFLRTHNRIANNLASFHRDWNDEIIYQETKKIVSALVQHITYTQFIEALLGPNNGVQVSQLAGAEDFYNDKINPTISLPFSTSAYRLHTFVPGSFLLADQNYIRNGELRLRDIFHKPLLLLDGNNYDNLMRGITMQNLHEFNNVFTPEMTEWMFMENGRDFGHDIVALNIQRGRDHQIESYIAYKNLCGIGPLAKRWEDLGDVISPDNLQRLRQVYARPEDVDLYIGQNMERVMPGNLLGPTANCLIREQFFSLRNGDRYFYTRPNQFRPDQLAAIKRVTFSRLLCDSSDDPNTMSLPINVFRTMSAANPAIRCSDLIKIPPLDLTPWK